jgi:hypothetical protein
MTASPSSPTSASKTPSERRATTVFRKSSRALSAGWTPRTAPRHQQAKERLEHNGSQAFSRHTRASGEAELSSTPRLSPEIRATSTSRCAPPPWARDSPDTVGKLVIMSVAKRSSAAGASEPLLPRHWDRPLGRGLDDERTRRRLARFLRIRESQIDARALARAGNGGQAARRWFLTAALETAGEATCDDASGGDPGAD